MGRGLRVRLVLGVLERGVGSTSMANMEKRIESRACTAPRPGSCLGFGGWLLSSKLGTDKAVKAIAFRWTPLNPSCWLGS